MVRLIVCSLTFSPLKRTTWFRVVFILCPLTLIHLSYDSLPIIPVYGSLSPSRLSPTLCPRRLCSVQCGRSVCVRVACVCLVVSVSVVLLSGLCVFFFPPFSLPFPGGSPVGLEPGFLLFPAYRLALPIGRFVYVCA